MGKVNFLVGKVMQKTHGSTKQGRPRIDVSPFEKKSWYLNQNPISIIFIQFDSVFLS